MSEAAVALASKSIERIVADDLVPIVRRIDRDGLYPEGVLRQLGVAGAYRAHAAPPSGQSDLYASVEVTAAVARACLSTAFCVWCQDACVWYLSNSENEALRERMLTALADGAVLAGTALSNGMKALSGIEPLRLTAQAVSGGYVVSGTLPWVSHIGPGQSMAIMFAVGGAEGRKVMAMVDCDAEGVTLAGDHRFLALDGTNTFAVTFRRVVVSQAAVLADPVEPFIGRIRAGFILLQVGMALGLVRGCVDLMEAADLRHGKSNRYLPHRPREIAAAARTLAEEAERLSRTPHDPSTPYLRSVLQVRLDAGELSIRAAESAMLHAGAMGYVRNASAQRRLREAFFIAIVTPSHRHLRRDLAALQAGSEDGWRPR